MRTATAALTTLLATGLPGQQTAQPSSGQAGYDDAFYAWDAGDYVPALEGFARILAGTAAEQYFRDIALLTGELFDVVEVAPDGRSITISPDGRHGAYQTRQGARTVTHVVGLADRVEVAALESRALVFSPTEDRAAYLGADGTLMHLDLQDGAQTAVDTGGLALTDLVYAPDGSALLGTGGTGRDAQHTDIYSLRRRPGGGFGVPRALTSGDGFKRGPVPAAGGRKIVYRIVPDNPLAGAGFGRRGRGRGAPAPAGVFVVLDLATGARDAIAGNDPVVAADGSVLAYTSPHDGHVELRTLELNEPAEPVVVMETENRLGGFAVSPAGTRVVYQMMPVADWELYVAPTAGGPSRRLTREIQHDLDPRFLDEDTVLGLIGESRHRRSHLHDVTTGERTRLFHNNTVRTIAPEYEWDASADGTRIMIVSERDGDTVSPERAVYLVDRTRRIGLPDLQARIGAALAAERDLIARGEAMFAPIADRVEAVTSQVSIGRLYRYQKSLYDFDSKNIARPGNALARDYIKQALDSFGYQTELQWFTPRGRGGRRGGDQDDNQTANVLATLRGTENPELVYIVSSHFDSTSRGPGADDNTSGTSVTIEAARVLARHPQPATIVFAAFTGEESGLLGSREWVRQAVENRVHVVGALNNDMLGWSNDHRLDNTIRYSNKGIRDVQHSAARLFSELITYDALYYKSTDAAAYYDAYGDIVGGIGSYPVLGNPHYHQPTDHLETINHELIEATCRTTVATLMLLASSPSRITGLQVAERSAGSALVTWDPSPERSVVGYEVAWGPASDPLQNRLTVDGPSAALPGAGPDTHLAVRATNARGLHGWDWAHLTLAR